ncbi:class I SAM-dependent methyltransferase [bacterium]|nr:class I SAM-dependent methyltransferase [bacterium]
MSLLHGDRPQAVGWSPQGQLTRHKAMLDVGDISNSQILDYGCGKGDFYTLLDKMGITVAYTGIDINENLIAMARKTRPELDFRVSHIEKEELEKNFDYIFICGVFNIKFEGVEESCRNTLRKLFRHCNKTLVFNALSTEDLKKDFALQYFNPEEMLNFALNELSPRSRLRPDSGLSDFTLFISKNMENI